MTFAALPSHMRGRREKVFGHRSTPIDRNGRWRIIRRAEALMKRTEPGRAYGAVSAKALAVLKALLDFANRQTGVCFPSYEAIAEKAACARSTVGEAIKALEAAGLIGWINRLVRERVVERDLFGRREGRWRVLRTSNSYVFLDPAMSPRTTIRPVICSKSDFQTGTTSRDLNPYCSGASQQDSPLESALARLGLAIGAPGWNSDPLPKASAGAC